MVPIARRTGVIVSETVFAPSLNLLSALLKKMQIDPQAFIENTLDRPIDQKLLQDPNARVSYRDTEKIWLALEQAAGDQCPAIRVTELVHPSYLGALGYAWLASSSLRTAFNRLERYIHMISEGINITLEEANDSFIVLLEQIPVEHDVVTRAHSSMAIIVEMCRKNYGSTFTPEHIYFRHGEPACSSEYYGFFRCPISFGAADNRLLLPLEVIDQPLPGSNPMITEASDRIIVDYMARMKKSDIVTRVKAEILRQLPSGGLTDQSVAGGLHMSERSMQRALQEKQQTYKKLLTEVRQDLSLKYLRDNSLSLTEISFMLGFSEMSSFSRAFKQWTGQAPSSYRG